MKIGQSVMPKVGGKPFRCTNDFGSTNPFPGKCDGNVFTRVEPYNGFEVLRCNSCGAEYQTDQRMEVSA